MPAARRFVLIMRQDGRTSRLPVRSSRVRFSPDVGPDGRGGLSVVYVRCATGRQRCDEDLYRYDLRSRTERRLPVSKRGRDESAPALWGTRVAFLRDISETRGEVVLTNGTRVLRRMQGSVLDNGDRMLFGRPTAVDLQGDRVLFAWNAGPGDCTQPTGDVKLDLERAELWTGTSGHRARRLFGRCDDVQVPFAFPMGAELVNGQAAFLAYGTAQGEDSRVFRLSLSTGALTSSSLPSGVDDIALDGRRLLYARRTLQRTGQGIFAERPVYGP